MQPARLIIQKMMKYEKYIKSILSTIVLNEKKNYNQSNGSEKQTSMQ